MEKTDIIIDRILLMAEVFEKAPEAGREIAQALAPERADALLRELDALTDEAERFFAASEPETPPAPEAEVFENGFVCPDCELRCRVEWDAEKNITGMRCQCGLTHARALLGEEKK